MTTTWPSVAFGAIADELWQCWKSVLYGVEARLRKLGSDSQRTDWLANTYRPELWGCLKRVYAALPYDTDLTDCSPEFRPALRNLKQLVNRLWREYAHLEKENPNRILAQADEAHFGEMVATFDRIRSQIEPPAPTAGIEVAEVTRETPKSDEFQPMTLARGHRTSVAPSETSTAEMDMAGCKTTASTPPEHSGSGPSESNLPPIESAIGHLSVSAKHIVLALGRNGYTSPAKLIEGKPIAQLPKSRLKFTTPMKTALAALQHSPFEFLKCPGRGYYLTERGITAYGLLHQAEGRKQKSGQSLG